MIIIATRKRYYAWCEVQKQTIEMLSIMIKQILLKYEAQEYMRKGMSKYEIKRILEEKIESDPDLKYYLDNEYTIKIIDLLVEGISEAFEKNNEKLIDDLLRHRF